MKHPSLESLGFAYCFLYTLAIGLLVLYDVQLDAPVELYIVRPLTLFFLVVAHLLWLVMFYRLFRGPYSGLQFLGWFLAFFCLYVFAASAFYVYELRKRPRR